jgi:DNA polymerase I
VARVFSPKLLFELPESEIATARALITEGMKNALLLDRVPVEVETGTGSNWLEAH